jgi:hypothetical protein
VELGDGGFDVGVMCVQFPSSGPWTWWTCGPRLHRHSSHCSGDMAQAAGDPQRLRFQRRSVTVLPRDSTALFGQHRQVGRVHGAGQSLSLTGTSCDSLVGPVELRGGWAQDRLPRKKAALRR